MILRQQFKLPRILCSQFSLAFSFKFLGCFSAKLVVYGCSSETPCHSRSQVNLSWWSIHGWNKKYRSNRKYLFKLGDYNINI